MDEQGRAQRAAGVACVIDVRSTPWSRRFPQFGREALAGALAAAGIDYRHEGAALGGKPADGAGYEALAARPAFAAALDPASLWSLVDFLHANADAARLGELNGRVAGDEIRSSEVNGAVSPFAAIPELRSALLNTMQLEPERARLRRASARRSRRVWVPRQRGWRRV